MIRLAEPADAARMVEWSYSTPHNDFDSRIANYEHLVTFVVEDASGPVLHVPVHPVLSIESVAVRPGITAKKYIMALLEAKKATEDLARQYGLREIYTSSGYRPAIKTFERHGYEPIVSRTVLRKRVA